MKQKVKPQIVEDFVYRFIRFRQRKKQLHYLIDTENTEIPNVRTVHAFYEDKGYRFVIDFQEGAVSIMVFEMVHFERLFGHIIVRHTESKRTTTKYF